MGLKVISFVDRNGNVLLKERLTSLPLREEYIINKSIELFNDCEPCIIHRTFVMKKIFIEIDEYFDGIIREGKNEVLSEFIPESIFGVLDLKGQVRKVIIA